MQMNPKLKNYVFGFVLLPLALFAIISKARDAISFQETAPLFVIANFEECLLNLNKSFFLFIGKQRPKKCSDLKNGYISMFKDSKILYEGNTVIGIQGQDPQTKRWYQVDTTDERYMRVVKYEE
jgi:hypothetical protein